MKWIDLGFNAHIDEAASKLPAGQYTIIRDDDAAVVGSTPYWGVELPANKAEHEYEADGGTVSASYTVTVKNKGNLNQVITIE